MGPPNVGPLSPTTHEFLTYISKPTMTVNNVAVDPNIKVIFEEFKPLFTREIGTVKNFEVKFELTPDA